MIAQFLSGFVIAVVGFFVTFFAHRSDLREKQSEIQLSAQQTSAQSALAEQESKAQLKLSDQQSKALLTLTSSHDDEEFDLENRKNDSSYLDKILAANSIPKKRAELIDQMEVALRPDDTARIAMHYAHPPFALDENKLKYADDKLVFESAMRVLDFVKKSGIAELRDRVWSEHARQ